MASDNRTSRAVLLGSGRSPLQRLLQMEHFFDSEGDRQRAIAVAMFSLLFGVLGVGGGLLLLVLGEGMPPLLAVADIVLGIAFLDMFVAARQGKLALARLAFVLLSLAVPALQSIPFDFIRPEVAALAYAVPIFTAAFLVGAGWSLAVTVAAIALTALSIYTSYVGSPALVVEAFTNLRPNSAGLIFVQLMFLLSITALLSVLVSANVFNWAHNVERRAAQLEAAVVVTETAAGAPNLRALLNEVVERIRDVYGFYHAQVFLLDEQRQVARLEASTGRAGETLLARGHSLPVGSQSVVGMCTSFGTPVVVNDVRASHTHKPNPLLPDTRAELALPLAIGGEVIGAIDVQSTALNPFQPTDVRSLEVMAVQLAAAIDKARLVDQLRARVAENERLFEEMEGALRQLDELNRRLTREGWDDFLRARRAEALGFSRDGAQAREAQDWTPAMLEAAGSQAGLAVRQEGDRHVAALAMRLRGEVIGALEIERVGEAWSAAELELAQALVDRLAQAVEKARLYEQARRTSAREQLVNQIGQEIESARSVDDVLQAALAELGDVLGASHGVVQINPRGAVEEPAAAEPAATTVEA